jgi:hypothetical protein
MASRKLRGNKFGGRGFIFFGLLAPNLFATLGILLAYTYAYLTDAHFQPGTYVLFAVPCGARPTSLSRRSSGLPFLRRARRLTEPGLTPAECAPPRRPAAGRAR